MAYFSRTLRHLRRYISFTNLNQNLLFIQDTKKCLLLFFYACFIGYDEEELQNAPLPNVSDLTEEQVIFLFTEVVSFMELFEMYCNTNSSCNFVADQLDRADRDNILLHDVLKVPNDTLKVVVMRFFTRVSIDHFSFEEVDYLANQLFTTTAVSAGESEIFLASVMEVLTRILHTSTFRNHSGSTIIKGCFDILLANSSRDMKFQSKEEIEQKMNLSLAACNALCTLSGYSDLRKHFRGQDNTNNMYNILQYEDKYRTEEDEDIVVERTWSGRELTVLIPITT